MKLRLRHNSLRLRLTRSELDRFAANGRVEERIDFPDGASLVYALEADRDAQELAALFAGSLITVKMPWTFAQEWASTDRVGFESEGNPLSILIEKDFQCAHGEHDPDAFAGGNACSTD